MYQAPTRGDFQRNVSVVIHEVRAKFKAENGRIVSNLAARGLARSGALISDVVSCANRFHAEIIDRSMQLAGEFVGRSNLTPAELAQAVRPVLENLTIEFLAPLMTQRYPQPQGQRAMAQYTQVFQQRLEGALRDMQIGFIGGRNVAGQLEQTIQANAFELLKAIERTTRGSGEPAHLEELHNLHMTDGEAQAAFRYLSDKGLIATHFGIPLSGRMTAAGHDAIKEAESTPDKTSVAFPAITNKYYMTVHNMMGSNVQQGTINSQIAATQSITTQQLIEGVQRLIEQLDPSTLPAPLQDPTRKAIAELRTAVDEPMPDVNRLHRGLQSLKRVMEHATGHLVATGVLGLIAQLLSAGVAH